MGQVINSTARRSRSDRRAVFVLWGMDVSQQDEIDRKQQLDRILMLENRIDLLQMRVDAQAEIIAAYRDCIETFQNEKRLQTSLHLADLKQLTSPKA